MKKVTLQCNTFTKNIAFIYKKPFINFYGVAYGVQMSWFPVYGTVKRLCKILQVVHGGFGQSTLLQRNLIKSV